MLRIFSCSMINGFCSNFAWYAPFLQLLENPYTVTAAAPYGSFSPSLCKPPVIQIPFVGKLLEQFSYGIC